MRENRLVYFCLAFFHFTCNCFAYDIELYSGQAIPGSEAQGILSLVFCPLDYQGNEVFLKDIDVLIARLSKVKPFDEFIRNIGFYYIVLSKEEENLIFKETEGFPPLKVRSDFLEDILTKLKSTYKLVIIDAGGSVSCAELSSINKLSLIILGGRRYKDEDSFAKGFLHELGHSLGLRDECVNYEPFSPPGEPNCATTKEEAERWWGDLVGKNSRANYISGCCAERDFIRPTIASLMNDPDKADDFGPVNERYLRKGLESLRRLK